MQGILLYMYVLLKTQASLDSHLGHVKHVCFANGWLHIPYCTIAKWYAISCLSDDARAMMVGGADARVAKSGRPRSVDLTHAARDEGEHARDKTMITALLLWKDISKPMTFVALIIGSATIYLS